MTGGEQFYEVDNMTQKLEAASKDKDGKNIIPMKRKPVNIDVLDKAGRERLAAKLEVLTRANDHFEAASPD